MESIWRVKLVVSLVYIIVELFTLCQVVWLGSLQYGTVEVRRAHNPKVTGSTPVIATFFLFLYPFHRSFQIHLSDVLIFF